MFNSGDRAYLQQLNSQLVNAIEKPKPIDISDTSIKNLADAIANAIKSGPTGGGGGGGGGGTSGTAGGADKAIKDTLETFKLLAKIKQVTSFFDNMVGIFDGAAKGVFKFGNAVGRVAVATNNLGLIGLKGADLSKPLDFQRPDLQETFGLYGFGMGDAGEMLATALRSNVKATSQNSQIFLARSVGLGTELGTVVEFLATNTQALGSSEEATINLGHSVLESSKQSGIFADTVFKAIKSFEQSTKQQSVIYGKGLSMDMQAIVAGFTKEMGFNSPELIQLLSKLTPTTTAGIAETRALAQRLAVDPALLGEDQGQFIAEMISAISRTAQDIRASTADEFSRAAQFGALLPGIDLAEIQAASRVIEKLGTSGNILKSIRLSKPPTDKSLAKTIEEESNAIRSVNLDAAKSMADFSLSLAGAANTFDVLETAQGAFRDALYKSNEELSKFAEVIGAIGTPIAGAFDIGGTFAPGILGSFTDIAESAAGVYIGMKALPGIMGKIKSGGLYGGGTTPGGILPGKLPFRGAIRDSFFFDDSAYRNKSLTGKLKGMAGAPGSRGVGSFLKSTKGFGIGAGIGGLIEAGMEYSEHGDLSRAASKGVGAAGGGWAGAAAGAALGTLVGGPIGTVIGGLIGGIAGSIGGAELGESFDETFGDPIQPRTADFNAGQTTSMYDDRGDQDKTQDARTASIDQKQLEEARTLTDLTVKIEEHLARLSGVAPAVAVGPNRPRQNMMDQVRDLNYIQSAGMDETRMRDLLYFNSGRA